MANKMERALDRANDRGFTMNSTEWKSMLGVYHTEYQAVGRCPCDVHYDRMLRSLHEMVDYLRGF
jgi:hypothetical protein